MLCLVKWDRFIFWYLAIVFIFIRSNNASMWLTVFLRRFFYYNLPKCLQWLTAMEETPSALKGKHGAYYEHLVWPCFFYFFYGTQSTVPFYIKNTTMIDNCKFSNNTFDYLKWPY